ncbi:uncharacterized protein LOC108115576 [Drosophila eugracilis]|uniref:uncharacterized protein LOC108115576 n=1 Tax=Drosophila eugracilis TaxID=29029 RepID=UPI0007E779DB|nr:uncharacterized protein LOC108115576 [Drosophila eugracilis]XP_017082575.1 uncharacterized protein LOC108115576 [Drosophila eugracilis]
MSPLLPLASLIILANLVAARPYSYGPRPAVPPTRLANRILVQSPSLDNLYMDYVVTSKPLNLRKYNKNGSKTKKTKKDSKIYYIPVPPLPFRHIPGVGLDYQPMKINPILQEEEKTTTTTLRPSTTTSRPNLDQWNPSKVLRVQHHKDYYFNGRPHRLQVAHAGKKSGLTALNLKSNFYYNKNIIY